MRRLILPLSALSLALAACGPVNSGLETVHQPVVSRANYVLDLSKRGTALAPGEDWRLAYWFDALKVGYGDKITVDDPAPSRATRDAIAAVTARYGLLLGDTAPPSDKAVEAGSVRIVLSRSFASVQGCPDWSRASMPEWSASTMSNYGCAASVNLAAMVANPQDLIAGETNTASDARFTSRAIKAYRDATPGGGGGTTINSSSAGGGGSSSGGGSSK